MRGFESISKLRVVWGSEAFQMTGLHIEIRIYGFPLMGISGSATNGFSFQ
jgi:hypothetical protein